MTENEAILYIEKWYQPTTEPKEREKSIEALSVVLKCIEEIRKYREIGTVEECREAVEKQKQKKIIIKDWNPTKCPTCNYELSTSLGDGYYKHPTFLERCPNCGQAIRWEESEGE